MIIWFVTKRHSLYRLYIYFHTFPQKSNYMHGKILARYPRKGTDSFQANLFPVKCFSISSHYVFATFQYCHYVAGLVGIGLSKLFSASELEDSVVGEDTALSNSMGLFLQKTNIIRDYLEDVVQDRCFWPQQVWHIHYTHSTGY